MKSATSGSFDGPAFGRRSEAASGAPAERPACWRPAAGPRRRCRCTSGGALRRRPGRVTTLQATVHPHHPPGAAQDPHGHPRTLYLQGSDFVHFAFAAPEDLILHLTPRP